ncbi:restriction endonuclease subunit S [Enterococcus raffinosus]|uniref:restriction endonuclease subunit S n=1 Tax=Enterococcus raffinosus TaxID=71452 RepID=UPI00288C9DB6|nr:restriction endonuclease subunit S [Enterococcus raffinosus]MDT2525829.1 restriction endonuclease subunit S [Enterococcus raffinosus]MDT2536360.1 restriction endonuclease subunit S [Enterococcus raffinosus]MDT2593193.1 restriction endonuclease subunit S [Enterococcus raffinosus]
MAKIDDSVKKKVPELRFKGFTDDWEERKFDECFNFPVSTNSLSRALLNYDEGDIKSVHYGDILIKYPAILNIKNDKIPYITGGKLEKYKSSLLENGDVIFADAAEDETVGKAVEVNGLTEENLVAGLHTIVARPKDKKAEFFLGYYINSNTYHRQLLRLIQGSKVSSISKGNLQKTLVSFPKDFEEQQKIGAFFKKIDDTIALHQRKLDLLKETKKGFLQKMFPKNGAKVPEIRFSGFTEDWEQRKLKYIFKYRQGQQVPVENQYFESGENRQKFIRIVDLTQKNEVPRYIEYFGENIIQKDDLFMIRYGQPGIVGYGYNGVIANNLFRLIPKISINNLFFYFILQGMFPMISKLSSSTTMPALSFNSLDLLEVKFPSSLIEQQKIGSFFKQLDDIITLHQRKLDLLKEQKKGFLQKMFV